MSLGLAGRMLARGLKRKRQEDGAEEGAQVAYSLQRQSLLDMSLVKLQLCHMLVEPSLCRSVLIGNTVRQIQEEMAQDGAWSAAAPRPADPAPLQRLVSTELLCRPVHGQDGGQSGLGDGAHAVLAPSPGVPPPASPQGPEDSLWGAGDPHDGSGGLPAALGQIFETLEGKSPGAAGELLEASGTYCDLDLLTGMVGGMASSGEGLEGFAATATPCSSCKSDLGEREHVVGVLVEA